MDAKNADQKKGPKDLVDLILEDHVTVREAYKKIQKGHDEETDQKIYEQMSWDIAKHAVAEETVFYPLMEKHMGKKGKELAAASREDHEETKAAMTEIDGIPLTDCRPQVDKMMKGLIEHMEKEETEDLIEIRKDLSKEVLLGAADDFVNCKHLAPQVGKSSGKDKLPFESPVALLKAPKTKIKAALKKSGAKTVEGDDEDDDEEQDGEQSEDSEEKGDGRYNLRRHDAQDGNKSPTKVATGEKPDGDHPVKLSPSKGKDQKSPAGKTADQKQEKRGTDEQLKDEPDRKKINLGKHETADKMNVEKDI